MTFLFPSHTVFISQLSPIYVLLSTESLTKSLFQFFDADSLLPPPFTFLSLLMYMIKSIEKKTRSKKSSLQRSCTKKFRSMAAQDIEYRSLIFSFIDNFKPQPDSHKGNQRISANAKQQILCWSVMVMTLRLQGYFVVSRKYLNFYNGFLVQEFAKCLVK